MKFLKISRIEFFVLFLLMLSFFFVLSPNEEKKAAATNWYIDYSNNTAPFLGTAADPWPCFDYITWGSLTSGDTIFVAAGDYSPANTIDIQVSDINFVANGNVYVFDNNLGSTDHLINMDYTNSCDSTEFDGFYFLCETAGAGDRILSINGASGYEINYVLFENCYFCQDTPQAIYATYADNLTINNCIVERATQNYYTYSGIVVFLENCDGLTLTDTEITLTYGSDNYLNILLYIQDCTDGNVRRNIIRTSEDCGFGNYGMYLTNCSDCEFYNNVVFGHYRYSSVYDDECLTGIVFNHNTIINLIGDETYGGIAYHAVRNSLNRISSFRNNICTATSISGECYPIYLSGTASYWSPSTAAMCDYNDYFNNGGMYVGFWYGTNCSDISAWQTASSLDANSFDEDPDFYDIWRMNDPGTPACIMSGGTYLGSSVMDIDGGARLSTSVSIGADQYSCVVINPTFLNFGTKSANSGYYYLPVTVTNYGISDFVISNIAVNPAAGPFSIYSGGTSTWVAPGVAHTITIMLDTTSLSAQPYTSVLVFNHNASMNHGSTGFEIVPIQVIIQ